ncbi:2-dehydropantoate 2-reductase [Baekduia soli]|uniref:2-dehydropantoate 2-reductase n=1 Tax=Baekduia soli TaxID=496014 RepID=A0A5B8U8W6_9ACTN|nr:2-dehydropantoate 2-reductase [Baekduia soli]QEC49504.1 2-dehydropantoate 2-reductase [Baekduia soli]
MRLAIFGAGAIGTWLGAALTACGEDVTLIGRGAHLEALRRHGAVLDDGATRTTVAVRAVGPEAAVGPVDCVVLAVKAHDLAACGPVVEPLLGPGTTLVAAQNGLPWWYFHRAGGPHDGRRVHAVDPGGVVGDVLVPERVLGAVVYLGAGIPEPGVVVTRPEAGLVLGEPSGPVSERLEAVATVLERAGFPVRRSTDIRTELWTKLMGNASFNLMSVLTRAGLRTMATDAGTGPLVAAVMAETVEIARACGADPRISVAERLALAARLGDHKPSTLQDLEAGKRLELDALGAAVVELADLTGVAAPALRTVYALADLQARTLGLR